MVKLFWRLWHSPTFTTWGSYFVSGLNWLVVLPILLNKFSAAEIALWYLFRIFIDSRSIADIGFGSTFIREIAYANGGAQNVSPPFSLENSPTEQRPNWKLIQSITQTMESVYNRLTVILLVILIALSPIFIRPISQIEHPEQAWTSWGIIIVTFALGVRGNSYSSFLQGMNRIALYRRWDTLFWSIAMVGSIILLILGGGILELVIVNQSIVVLAFFRNRILTQKIIGDQFRLGLTGKIDQELFSETWSRTWRSGLGVFMSYGITQGSGIIYAQLGTTNNIASYLLALRIAQTITMFSGAPFYSKLPLLASLYSQNKRPAILDISSRSMRISHWIFVTCYILVGLFLPPVLSIIKSNAMFVSASLWILMGIGFFAERFGAMHLQLYSISNHIIWHIANGVSGMITVIICWILFGSLGIGAFPVGYAVGYLGFYSWYSAIHSYKKFAINFKEYEIKTSLSPLLLFIAYVVMSIVYPLNDTINQVIGNIFRILHL